MSEIYDLPLSYRLVKKYIKVTFTRFYDEFIVLGTENIPLEGPVIFAPNHLNGLMDALAVITIAPDNYSTVFLARSDLFKSKLMARILRTMKIMPAFRIRDGIENLSKNNEIFDKCVEILTHNNALGIMPEGNQELERKIRPLVKGIFRIAFSAQQAIGETKNIKIIPVGIEFEDLIKFGKKVIVNIGQPIDVQNYMKLYYENPVLALNKIKNELKLQLENLTVHLDSKDFYHCFETAVLVTNEAMMHKMGLQDSIVNRFSARREIAKKLVETEKNATAKILELNRLTNKLKNRLNEYNFKIDDITRTPDKKIVLAMKSIMLFISLPVYIVGFLFNFLPFFAPVFIRKATKVQFAGFFSSFHYGLGILMFPVFYFLQMVLFVSLLSMPWWMGVLIIPMEYVTGKFAFFGWYTKFKMLISDFKIIKFRKWNAENANTLLQLSNQISKIIIY
ncbi:MAG: 1-acyl-sn-glycerol-3-phosphate acyltransferase [Paludibacter sp.]|nr:1-acyl-sn-glycerol-3-phosphate acyltransferase [Paludibacter sp.]